MERDLSRRGLLMAGLGAAAATPLLTPALTGRALADTGPIVKPLPPDLFTVYGTNAEMNWAAMSGQGYLTPADRFFVRNHTRTPAIDAATWRLKLWGTGLYGSPGEDSPIEFGYDQLRRLPAETVTAFIECTGNGRSFYTTQQGQTVAGTPWKLGAVGVAQWRGVRLSTVLDLAGITRHAVDLMPRGLDDDYIDKGVNLGKVRRPLPVRKALHDVILAYEMNGAPLPPDNGFPVRLVVPSWIGIASIKWVGDIQVSDQPLTSPWNTTYYNINGVPLTRQVTKSAFELSWGAQLSGKDTRVLRGRSWSGNGRIRKVEVSTDGGSTWQHARRVGRDDPRAWQRWEVPWRPAPGSYELLARATDETGNTQPDTATYNPNGYLFGAVVRHPVSVS
jgi:DMSO/TMAO reductase YedYZ molybdopterin-dependent catalytic subunit